MATKTFDELKQLAIQIRDEKTNKQNTANRVGAAMLESINKLEQDYYDKTNIDEQSKNTTQSITNLNTKIDKRTTEYNVSVNNPTSGTNGSNKYDLSMAIAQVPSELRVAGMKVSFLNSTGKPESWKYLGGSWAVANFIQESSGGNKILEWAGDAAATRKQVAASERKAGMMITYKNANGQLVNEQYKSTNYSDTEWAKDSNWLPIVSQYQLSPIEERAGYVVCSTNDITVAKKITKQNFVLDTKCRLLVKMTYRNTANLVTLNINNTGDIPLFLDGERVSSINSWDANDVLDIFYDGKNYQATLYNKFSTILSWNTDVSTTRKQVPLNKRIAGMQISYKPDGDDWINEQYIGTSFTDTEWAKDENWEKVPKQSKVLELSYKINDIIGTDSVVLFDNLELVSRQEYKLPNDISDDSLIEFELLTDNISGNLLWGNGYKNNFGSIKYRIPIARQYRDMKSFIFEFQGVEKAYAKISILGKAGIISGQDRLLYKGGYSYTVSLSNLGLKVGDKLLVKNIPNEYSQNPQRVELFKNKLALDKLIVSVNPNFESVVSIPDETEGLYISVSGDTEIYVYQISESNDLNNQVLSQPLSEYDFIAAGDSITAWNTSSDTGIEGVEKFDGWANLLAGHIGFKSYSNIAIPGASYIQSSNVGSYTYSINRGIKEGVPEQYSGILAIMGGTNDYNGTNSLGNVEETMSKTYEDLDTRNSTNNFSTICDGFRYSLETAIRRCSWKARIFVITCLPRNNRGEYTVADMNEQIKLISKEFNVPVIDMFSELNLRNGLDQFGETWKLSEVSDDGGTENVHPNAETQKMMMRFIFGKLLTYIR